MKPVVQSMNIVEKRNFCYNEHDTLDHRKRLNSYDLYNAAADVDVFYSTECKEW